MNKAASVGVPIALLVSLVLYGVFAVFVWAPSAINGNLTEAYGRMDAANVTATIVGFLAWLGVCLASAWWLWSKKRNERLPAGKSLVRGLAALGICAAALYLPAALASVAVGNVVDVSIAYPDQLTPWVSRSGLLLLLVAGAIGVARAMPRR